MNVMESITAETWAPDTAQSLLEKTAQGDNHAFSALYDQYAPKVYGLSLKILHAESHAEEVTQEIFLEIWQTAAKYNASKGKPSTWIMTITHRRAVDRVRAVQKSYERDVKVGLKELVPASPTLEDAAETRDATNGILQALNHLTQYQREAILLAYYEGYSQKEIAERLHLPVNTVKTRIRDGMIRLRDELGVISNG